MTIMSSCCSNTACPGRSSPPPRSSWVRRLGPLRDEAGRPGALGRAGLVSLGGVAAHSCVDYPLRTAAIAVSAALAAALAFAPEPAADAERPVRSATRKPAGGSIRIALDEPGAPARPA